jgi:hypothetical protein
MLLALLALVAAALPIAACGADDVNPDAVAAAAEKTSAVGGMHVTGKGTVEVVGQEFGFDMDGVMSAKGDRAKLTLDMSDMAASAGGALSEDDLRGEQRIIGKTMYMSFGMFEKAFGTKWIKMDLEKALAGAGMDLGQMQGLGGQSPAEQLKFLKATSDIEKVGEEEVDGASTTRYKGTVDLREYPKLAEPKDREAAEKAIDTLIKNGAPATMPVEVWVDDEDMIRRQKFSMTMTTGGQKTKTAMDMRFSDFGADVEVSPPSGEVKDMTELASQGMKQGAAG